MLGRGDEQFAFRIVCRRERRIASISAADLPVAQTMKIWPNLASYAALPAARSLQCVFVCIIRASLFAAAEIDRRSELLTERLEIADARMGGEGFEPIGLRQAKPNLVAGCLECGPMGNGRRSTSVVAQRDDPQHLKSALRNRRP